MKAQHVRVFGSQSLAHLEQSFFFSHHRVDENKCIQFFVPAVNPCLALGAFALTTLTQTQIIFRLRNRRKV